MVRCAKLVKRNRIRHGFGMVQSAKFVKKPGPDMAPQGQSGPSVIKVPTPSVDIETEGAKTQKHEVTETGQCVRILHETVSNS